MAFLLLITLLAVFGLLVKALGAVLLCEQGDTKMLASSGDSVSLEFARERPPL